MVYFFLRKTDVSTNHQLHEACQTPEGLHLILGDEQDRWKEVAHPLYIPWTGGKEDKGQCQSNVMSMFSKWYNLYPLMI